MLEYSFPGMFRNNAKILCDCKYRGAKVAFCTSKDHANFTTVRLNAASSLSSLPVEPARKPAYTASGDPISGQLDPVSATVTMPHLHHASLNLPGPRVFNLPHHKIGTKRVTGVSICPLASPSGAHSARFVSIAAFVGGHHHFCWSSRPDLAVLCLLLRRRSSLSSSFS